MTKFSSLPPAEQARQLANPEGQLGLEIAEWLNINNRAANAAVIDQLDIQPSHRVLEIGFGNGRSVPDVLGRSTDVRYVGIDPSPTMLAEAKRFNTEAVAAGQASFHLASAEKMPFDDHSFDRVFAIGVIHFWQDPVPQLVEVRRVMRPGSLAVMQAIDARTTQKYARQEFGFHIRSAEDWETLFRQAGYPRVECQHTEVDGLTPDGAPNKRYAICVVARS